MHDSDTLEFRLSDSHGSAISRFAILAAACGICAIGGFVGGNLLAQPQVQSLTHEVDACYRERILIAQELQDCYAQTTGDPPLASFPRR